MNIKQLIELKNKDITDLKESSKYQNKIKAKELVSYFKNYDIKNIDYEKILQYKQNMEQKGLSKSTINSKLSYLSSLLTYAQRTSKLQNKPYIKFDKVNHNNKIKTISEHEFNLIIEWFNSKKFYQSSKAILIAYYTGARISNVLNIKSDDIENGYIRFYLNKTDKPYSIPIHSNIKNLFDDWQEFTISYLKLYRQFNRCKKELRLDKEYTIHTLRHTFATNLRKKGVPIDTISKALNHSNLQTTMIYNHISDEELEQAIGEL